MTRWQTSLVLLLTLSGSGCMSSELYKAEGYDPRVPLRVAVLPFVDSSAGDSVVSQPLVAALDELPLLSDDRYTKANAPTIFREKVQQNLANTPLDLVNLYVVDSMLIHRGLGVDELYTADRASSARALGEALGVDAVVFGDVVAWDRDFFMVETIVEAGVRIEMRDTSTGALLVSHQVIDNEASGISGLPIVTTPEEAIVATVGEAIRGLSNTMFVRLTDEIARTIVDGLAPDAETRAAAKAPRIHVVAHSLRSAPKPGDELVVLALGDPGARATFKFGPGDQRFPMTETAPGSYRGTVMISAGHQIGPCLTVRLLGAELRASASRVRLPTATAP